MITTLATVLSIIDKEIGIPSNKRDGINDRSKLKEDLGLDSLDMAQLLIYLEKLYPRMNIDIFFNEFRNEELTLNDLIIFIEKNS